MTRQARKLGIWNTTAAGGHGAVIWCRRKPAITMMSLAYVFDADCHGLLVEADDSLALSLLPHSSLEIENATHQNELAQPRHMFLRLLAGQMGVGGDDSVGRSCSRSVSAAGRRTAQAGRDNQHALTHAFRT